jgi:hypothetical protein
LRKFIESWFGKKFPTDTAASGFDHASLLSRKCLVNVTHTEKGEKTYANISAATPIPKGMTADYPQHNASLYFDLEKPDAESFNRLPEWLQKKINERIEGQPEKKSAETEYLGSGSSTNGAPYDDDIPF